MFDACGVGRKRACFLSHFLALSLSISYALSYALSFVSLPPSRYVDVGFSEGPKRKRFPHANVPSPLELFLSCLDRVAPVGGSRLLSFSSFSTRLWCVWLGGIELMVLSCGSDWTVTCRFGVWLFMDGLLFFQVVSKKAFSVVKVTLSATLSNVAQQFLDVATGRNHRDRRKGESPTPHSTATSSAAVRFERRQERRLVFFFYPGVKSDDEAHSNGKRRRRERRFSPPTVVDGPSDRGGGDHRCGFACREAAEADSTLCAQPCHIASRGGSLLLIFAPAAHHAVQIQPHHRHRPRSCRRPNPSTMEEEGGGKAILIVRRRVRRSES